MTDMLKVGFSTEMLLRSPDSGIDAVLAKHLHRMEVSPDAEVVVVEYSEEPNLPVRMTVYRNWDDDYPMVRILRGTLKKLAQKLVGV